MQSVAEQHKQANDDERRTKDEFAPFADDLLKSEGIGALPYDIN